MARPRRAPIPQRQSWPSPFDYSADPVLQQIMGAQQKAVRDAEARALAERQQAAIDYGDPELARQLGLDENFVQAAGENPYSTRAQLERGYGEQQQAANEALNKRNLFYSSTRGTVLGDLATGYGQQSYSASRDVQGRLGGITEALLGAQTGATGEIAAAQGEAAGRAMDRALQYGYNPASGLAKGEFMGQIRNLKGENLGKGARRNYRRVEAELRRQGTPRTKAALRPLLRAANKKPGTPYRDILRTLRRRRK